MKSVLVLLSFVAVVFGQLTGPETWYSPMGVVPTTDGRNNNLLDPAKGSILIPLVRNVPAAYADGFNSQREGPNTRNISNFVFTVPQEDGGFNPLGFSDMLTFWGQLIVSFYHVY